MPERMVINTGPLIALARMEALEIAGQLPYTFICPQEVEAELEAGVAAGHPKIKPPWLHVLPLQDVISPMVLPVLDAGEAAVIQLALENQIALVCLDEWKGRRMALAAGLRVTGALGLMGKAKIEGIISAVAPYVERAVRHGIRFPPVCQ